MISNFFNCNHKAVVWGQQAKDMQFYFERKSVTLTQQNLPSISRRGKHYFKTEFYRLKISFRLRALFAIISTNTADASAAKGTLQPSLA